MTDEKREKSRRKSLSFSLPFSFSFSSRRINRALSGEAETSFSCVRDSTSGPLTSLPPPSLSLSLSLFSCLKLKARREMREHEHEIANSENGVTSYSLGLNREPRCKSVALSASLHDVHSSATSSAHVYSPTPAYTCIHAQNSHTDTHAWPASLSSASFSTASDL